MDYTKISQLVDKITNRGHRLTIRQLACLIPAAIDSRAPGVRHPAE